jgi:hypothetical protein
VQKNRSAGAQECISQEGSRVGLPEGRSAVKKKCRRAGVQECSRTGTEYRSAGCMRAGVQECSGAF